MRLKISFLSILLLSTACRTTHPSASSSQHNTTSAVANSETVTIKSYVLDKTGAFNLAQSPVEAPNNHASNSAANFSSLISPALNSPAIVEANIVNDIIVDSTNSKPIAMGCYAFCLDQNLPAFLLSNYLLIEDAVDQLSKQVRISAAGHFCLDDAYKISSFDNKSLYAAQLTSNGNFLTFLQAHGVLASQTELGLSFSNLGEAIDSEGASFSSSENSVSYSFYDVHVPSKPRTKDISGTKNDSISFSQSLSHTEVVSRPNSVNWAAELDSKSQAVLSEFRQKIAADAIDFDSKTETRYELDDGQLVMTKLGEGAEGSVYRLDFSDGQSRPFFSTAVKLFETDGAESQSESSSLNENSIEPFGDLSSPSTKGSAVLEVQHYRSLSSHNLPHLTRYYGDLTEHSESFLFLEPLKTSLAKGPFEINDYINAAIAIDELHDAGFIHGDIKPSNMGLNESGELRIFDLGFLKPNTPGTLLKDGSAWYAAPEVTQWRAYVIQNRDGTYSYKSNPSHLYDIGKTDVYSLAMSIYRRKQNPSTDTELMTAVEKNFPDLNPRDPLDALLLQALIKDPSERIDMKTFLAGLKVLSVPNTH